MSESIAQRIEAMQVPGEVKMELRRLFTNALLIDIGYLSDRLKSQIFNSGALAIHGASSTLAKTAANVEFIAGGVSRNLTAADMPVLAGTVLQNTFGGWAFFVDNTGTVTAVFFQGGATWTLPALPAPVAGTAMLGYVRVNPTTAGFIGGTTFLDAANTNAVYVNTVGAVDPTTVPQLIA